MANDLEDGSVTSITSAMRAPIAHTYDEHSQVLRSTSTLQLELRNQELGENERETSQAYRFPKTSHETKVNNLSVVKKMAAYIKVSE